MSNRALIDWKRLARSWLSGPDSLGGWVFPPVSSLDVVAEFLAVPLLSVIGCEFLLIPGCLVKRPCMRGGVLGVYGSVISYTLNSWRIGFVRLGGLWFVIMMYWTWSSLSSGSLLGGLGLSGSWRGSHVHPV